MESDDAQRWMRCWIQMEDWRSELLTSCLHSSESIELHLITKAVLFAASEYETVPMSGPGS
jgi:hypothetical protein